MGKTLVTYFSASGVTKKLAETIAETQKWDIKEIEPAVPYSDADLNWTDSHSRSTVEMRDKDSRPEMKQPIDVSGYDTIFVGFPIWWGVAPHVVNTFLESQDFSGKTIVPFATSGGSGMGHTAYELQKSAPGAHVRNGRVMSARESGKAVAQWIDGLNL
jgi:flavodoxin